MAERYICECRKECQFSGTKEEIRRKMEECLEKPLDCICVPLG